MKPKYTPNRPKCRPTPSLNPDALRVVVLTHCDVARIRMVADCLSGALRLKELPADVVCGSVSELSQRDMKQCLRGLLAQAPKVFQLCCATHHYGLRVIDIDQIRTLLFDFEVALSESYHHLVARRVCPEKIQRYYEHCRQIRRKLRSPAT